MCRLQEFIFETRRSGGWSVRNATCLIFLPLSFSTLISSSKRETQFDISKKIAWKPVKFPSLIEWKYYVTEKIKSKILLTFFFLWLSRFCAYILLICKWFSSNTKQTSKRSNSFKPYGTIALKKIENAFILRCFFLPVLNRNIYDNVLRTRK